MTSSSLQESSQPVVVKSNSTGLVRPKVATPEALELLGVKPRKTVWGWQQRTILSRLPAESETYQIGYEDDLAYVYEDPAPGGDVNDALVVTYDVNDPQTLICGNGIITWKYGQATAERLAIDISALNEGEGLQTGEYQFGYTLRLDYPSSPSPIPGYSLQRVENASLGTAAIAFAVDGASEYHDDYFAVSDSSGAWWPGETTSAGPYELGSWYAIDFREAVNCERFTLIADPNEPPSASCAVYQSDDAIIWYKSNEVRPTNGEWNLDVRDSKAARYWRFFFYDGSASVLDFRYTGEAYFPDLRTVGPVTIAEPYLDDLYEEVEGDFIILAQVTVINGNITNIGDLRRFIGRKYEPVASWLTTFPDEQLTCLFDDVEHYATKYLSPPTADFHFYTELDDSICHGLGEFTLADEEDAPSIFFPSEVEIVDQASRFPIDPILEVSNKKFGDQGPLATDPDELEIQTEGVTTNPGVVGIFADGIDLVKSAVEPSDLSTMGDTLNTIVNLPYSADDGLY